MSQVVQVLETHWGKGWEQGFKRFAFTPVAAASIAQVHLATTGGRELAIKIQYPRVRQSIDSDVDNVATLLRVSGLQLSADKDMWRTLPADAFFLHCKLCGLYLLAARLVAKVDAGAGHDSCRRSPAAKAASLPNPRNAQ